MTETSRTTTANKASNYTEGKSRDHTVGTYHTKDSQHISVITISVNGLNSLIKRSRLIEWLKNQNSTICYIYKKHI